MSTGSRDVDISFNCRHKHVKGRHMGSISPTFVRAQKMRSFLWQTAHKFGKFHTNFSFVFPGSNGWWNWTANFLPNTVCAGVFLLGAQSLVKSTHCVFAGITTATLGVITITTVETLFAEWFRRRQSTRGSVTSSWERRRNKLKNLIELKFNWIERNKEF